MSLNLLVATIAVERLSKNDSSLYDAIAAYSKREVCALINTVYSKEVRTRGFIKEPIEMPKIVQAVEAALNKNKINIRMC